MSFPASVPELPSSPSGSGSAPPPTVTPSRRKRRNVAAGESSRRSRRQAPQELPASPVAIAAIATPAMTEVVPLLGAVSNATGAAGVLLEQNIQNNLAMQRAILNVQIEKVNSRPKNTNSSYLPRQQAYMKWCTDRKFEDGTLVSEGKLLLFLQEVVPALRHPHKKLADGTAAPLGISSSEQYTKAIIDLFKQQVAVSNNKYPHPRGDSVKSFLDSMQRRKETQRKAVYADRGVGTMVDGYSIPEFPAIVEFFMKENNVAGLRNRLDFSLGHATLLRGQSKRNWQLPDLFSVEIPNEGPTPCWALVIVMRQGKTNQFGKIEYSGAYRHKDATLCAVGALSLYLFARYHITNEPFPDFTHNRNWYDHYLLLGGKPKKKRTLPEENEEPLDEESDEDMADEETEQLQTGGQQQGQDNVLTEQGKQPITYRTQYRAVKKAFDACGIHSSRITHSSRASGAHMADIAGCSDASIRRLGHWGTKTMEGCYLTGLPLEALRGMAGFDGNGGTFYLPRASLMPPESLQKKIFPLVDAWLERYRTKTIDQDIAGQNFLLLLRRLRVVLLQDSVVLREKYRNHFVWNHGIFEDDEYIKYASDLKAAMPEDSGRDPLEENLFRVMPLLMESINARFADVRSRLDTISHEAAATDAHVVENGVAINRFHGRFADSMRLIGTLLTQLGTGPCSLDGSFSIPSITPPPPPPPPCASTASIPTLDSIALPQTPQQNPSVAALLTIGELNDPVSVVQHQQLDPNSIIVCSQDRSLLNVIQVWREYTLGLGSNPPIRDLERTYKAKWRVSASDKQHFTRRKFIYDEVKRLAQLHKELEDRAAERLEQRRTENGWTLDKLWKILREEKKNR